MMAAGLRLNDRKINLVRNHCASIVASVPVHTDLTRRRKGRPEIPNNEAAGVAYRDSCGSRSIHCEVNGDRFAEARAERTPRNSHWPHVQTSGPTLKLEHPREG